MQSGLLFRFLALTVLILSASVASATDSTGTERLPEPTTLTPPTPSLPTPVSASDAQELTGLSQDLHDLQQAQAWLQHLSTPAQTWPAELLLQVAQEHASLRPTALNALVQSLLAQGRPEAVRQLARQQRLTPAGTSVDPETSAQIRRWVIQSHLQQGHVRETYAAMLRYQQDHGLPDTEILVAWIGHLLQLGAEGPASNWARSLPAGHPFQLWLALRLGALDVQQLEQGLSKQALDAPRVWVMQQYASAEIYTNDKTYTPAQKGAQMHAALLQLSHPEWKSQWPNWPSPTPEQAWLNLWTWGETRANQLHLLQGEDQQWLSSIDNLSQAEPESALALALRLAAQGQPAAANLASEKAIPLLQRLGFLAPAYPLLQQASKQGVIWSPQARFLALQQGWIPRAEQAAWQAGLTPENLGLSPLRWAQWQARQAWVQGDWKALSAAWQQLWPDPQNPPSDAAWLTSICTQAATLPLDDSNVRQWLAARRRACPLPQRRAWVQALAEQAARAGAWAQAQVWVQEAVRLAPKEGEPWLVRAQTWPRTQD